MSETKICFQLEPGAPLPPPSLLKRKILIKNKRLKPEVEKIELELFQQGQFVVDNEEPVEDASAAPVLDKKSTEDVPTPLAALPGASQDGGEATDIPINYTGSTTNVHPWLSSMINYAQPVKFQSFQYAERESDEMRSLRSKKENYFRFLLNCREKCSSQHVIVL